MLATYRLNKKRSYSEGDLRALADDLSKKKSNLDETSNCLVQNISSLIEDAFLIEYPLYLENNIGKPITDGAAYELRRVNKPYFTQEKLACLSLKNSVKQQLKANAMNEVSIVRSQVIECIQGHANERGKTRFLNLESLHCDATRKFERAADGDLFDCYESKLIDSLADIRRVFAQIVLGVEILHKSMIAHNDLKLENILYYRDPKTKQINIKIISFKSAVIINENGNPLQRLGNSLGTEAYWSPEYNPDKHGRKSDSVGFRNYCAKLDFRRNDCYALGILLCELTNSSRMARREATPLINALCTRAPAKRLTIDKLKQQPFFGQTHTEREKYFNQVMQSTPVGMDFAGYYIIPQLDKQKVDNTFFILPPAVKEVVIQAEKLQNQVQAFNCRFNKVAFNDTIQEEKIEQQLQALVILRNVLSLKLAIAQAQVTYAEQLKNFFTTEIESSILSSIYPCLVNNDKKQVIIKLFNFISEYFKKYPVHSIKHGRHEELLELFSEVIAAKNNTEKVGVKIKDVLQKWRTHWKPGFFSCLVSSYGECGKFIDTLISQPVFALN